MSSGAPFISAVVVFSTEPITHVYLSPMTRGEQNVRWYKLPLVQIGTYQSWIEYCVKDWTATFPDGLLTNSGCESKFIDYDRSRVTFFDSHDCYGYFRNPNRKGYSVYEGDDVFVNYLEPPSMWTTDNHLQWPHSFKMKAFQVLLACKRLGGAWRNLAIVLIRQLAYTSIR